MGNRELCISLVRASSADEVINILKRAGHWDDESAWKDYGDDESNWSTVSVQQERSEFALVEKIINSVDASLMRECWLRNIDPKDYQITPQSITKAVEEFFDVKGGTVEKMWTGKIRELTEEIMLVATGQPKIPCLHIIDKGEGQTPNNFPQTMVSLKRGNKARIQFVQGRYNMGGTGVVPFCGNDGIQLFLSRRHPKIVEFEEDIARKNGQPIDESRHDWGFTVTRTIPPVYPMKNYVLRYLAPNDKVLRVSGQPLPLFPGEYPEAFDQPVEWGTLVKLYDYKSLGRFGSDIRRHLFQRLNFLLPGIALPIKIVERRKSYQKADHHEANLRGLFVTLSENRYKNVEARFSGKISIEGNSVDCIIYIFRKGHSIGYATKEGVAFVQDGQVQGHLPRTLFNRADGKLDYIKDSLLVFVDVTELPRKTGLDIVMGSRDRLRRTDLVEEIENQIIYMLKEHPEIIRLNVTRRAEEVKETHKESKPLSEALEKIMKISPAMAFFLNPTSKNLSAPFPQNGVDEKKVYKGETYPSFFDLRGNPAKEVPLNVEFRMLYDTDATNAYFRTGDPTTEGSFELHVEGYKCNYRVFLTNGVATLRVSLPKDVKIGDTVKFRSEVSDYSREDSPFISEFEVTVIPPAEKKSGGSSTKRKPRGKDESDKQKGPKIMGLPRVRRITKDDWGDEWNRFDALRVKGDGKGGFDFYLNIDNLFLGMEIKRRNRIAPEILQAQFEYVNVILGMAILHKDKRIKLDLGDEVSQQAIVAHVTKALAPVVVSIANDFKGK